MAKSRLIGIGVVANTKNFTTGMNSVRTQLGSFQKSVSSSLGSGITKLAGIAVATVGFYKLTAGIKESYQELDNVAKASARVGESASNIMALGHAADLAGSSQEALIKGFDMMNRKLGEANIGLKETKDAIVRLHLNLSDLQTMSPAQAFVEISQAIMKLPTASQRAIEANRLFGRSGQDLLNVMQEVAVKGLAGVTKEAERLGLTISQLDAKNIEEANDSFTRLNTIKKAIFNTIAVKLAPAILDLNTKILDMATTGDSMGVKVSNAFDKILKPVGFLYDSFVGFKVIFKTLEVGAQGFVWTLINGLDLVMDSLQKLINTFADSWLGGKMGIEPIVDTWSEGLQSVADDYKNAMDSNVDSIAKDLESLSSGGMTGKISDYFANLNNKTSSDLGIKKKDFVGSELAESFEDLIKESDKLKDSLKSPIEKFNEFRDSLEKFMYVTDPVTGKQQDLLSLEQYDILLAREAEKLFKDLKPEPFSGQSSFGTYNSKYMDLSAFNQGTSKDDRLINKQDEIIRKHSEAITVLNKIDTKIETLSRNSQPEITE